MRRALLLWAAAWLATGSALAEMPKIDRSIGKEPVYQTKTPKYCLLAFGPEGKDRVWLVQDGDTLYVDRNGDSDLTEAGKKVAAAKQPGSDPETDGYSFDAGQITVGGRTHKGLAVYFTPLQQYAGSSVGRRDDVKALLAKDAVTFVATILVDVDVSGRKGGGTGGRLSFSAGPSDEGGVLRFADKPAEAPIVRVGGPLEISFDGLPTLRVGRSSDLFLTVGTPGVGPGTFASLKYDGTIPEDAKPVAEVHYSPAKNGASPVTEKWVIEGRC